MKLNTLLRSAVVGAALAATSLFANTVYVYNTANDGGLAGGEFGVNSSEFGNFYTFCLEGSVSIALPGTYNYTVGIAALNQNDTLSVGSAWLYEKFFLGTLSGPAPASNYLDDRDTNAGLLQQAFWYLENEANGANNYYVGLVTSAFGSLAGAKADITTSSKVKVLNLWGLTDNKDVQSQLVYVPDSGMTALLLGLGLLSLAAFRRKL